MIFFFYGENSFLAHQKIQAIREKFHSTVDQSGQNIQNFDGEELSSSDFFKAVKATGFLATKKLIIIRNLFKNKKLKNWQDELIDFLGSQKDTPAENYLIFWEDSHPSPQSKLYKALKKFKYTEEFPMLSPSKLVTWTKNEFKKKIKKIIQPKNLEILLSYVGNNLWQLNQEIQKLVNYSSQTEITETDINDVIQAKASSNIFNLVDALGRKDKKQALKILEEQISAGVEPIYILTMVIRQFRLLIKIKILSHKIKNNFALAQALKIHTFVAQKSLGQSKIYSLEELKKIYAKLLLLDEQFKSSTISEKVILDQLINQL